MTLHARESVRSSLDDSVYASQDMAKAAPKYRFPTEEWRAEDAFAVVADELMLDGNSRQNLATFCQTWEEPAGPPADGPGDRQEHDRQGRVPADGGDRAALRAHARRPVERARVRQHGGRVGDRIVGGVHARRDGGQVAVAGEASGGRPAGGSTEHGVRAGAGRVAQVRQVLGHRDARGADVAGALRDGRRRHAGPRRREHDHGRADVRRHLHRRLRARCKPLADALDTLAGRHRARRRHPRRRRQRRLPRPVLRARHRMGLPAARG